MSRSGYTDDYGDDDPLAPWRWRQAVKRAIEGRRGQALLRDLAAALDAMPDKRLYRGSFATEGEFCALGVLGATRGTKMDDLGDADYCEPEEVGRRFGIARSMAAEIMYLNDEHFDDWDWVDVEICGPMRRNWPDWGRHTRTVRVPKDRAAEQRWSYMRSWVAGHLKTPPTSTVASDSPSVAASE